MSTANPSDFLISLGQALAGMALYAPEHGMRHAARQRVFETLRALLPPRGVVRFSFLHGDAIFGATVLDDLRTWDWSRKLAAVGIQRIEIDAVPLPTDADLEQFLQAIHRRLHVRENAPGAPIAIRGLRAGLLALDEDEEGGGGGAAGTGGNGDGAGDDDGVRRDGSRHDGQEAIALPIPSLVAEADAVRWIHDEAANGRAMPLNEVEAVVHGLAAAMQRDQHVLMPLLELKSFDQYTTTHSCNVSMLSMGLAQGLGFATADVRAIGTAALLHDIGKVKVPVEVLVKPGRLADDEMALMRGHVVEGARMLGARGRGHALAAVVAYEHHAWADGSGGYPTLRFARRCHYASRLVHVCDLYDALSTRRPYREAWPRERVLSLLRERAGIETDPELVEAFISVIGRTVETRSTVDDTPQNDWNAQVAETARQMEAAEALPAAEG